MSKISQSVRDPPPEMCPAQNGGWLSPDFNTIWWLLVDSDVLRGVGDEKVIQYPPDAVVLPPARTDVPAVSPEAVSAVFALS